MKFKLRRKGGVPDHERQLVLALVASLYDVDVEPPQKKPPTPAPHEPAKLALLKKGVA